MYSHSRTRMKHSIMLTKCENHDDITKTNSKSPHTWVVGHAKSPIGKKKNLLGREFPLAPNKYSGHNNILPSFLEWKKIKSSLQLPHICFNYMTTIKHESIAHPPIVTWTPIHLKEKNNLRLWFQLGQAPIVLVLDNNVTKVAMFEIFRMSPNLTDNWTLYEMVRTML